MSAFLIKILAICIITAILAITLKPKSGEYALILSLAGGIVITFMLINAITPAIKSFNSLLKSYGITTEYFGVAVKAVGISYISSFIADSCRDCGQSSLAAKAEFAGKCAIFLLSLPLLTAVLETAVGFVK